MGFFDEVVQMVAEEFIEGIALEEAITTMEAMPGNEGQQRILEDGLGGFEEWANDALNGDNTPINENALGISHEKFQGTYQIWETGQDIIWAYADATTLSDE